MAPRSMLPGRAPARSVAFFSRTASPTVSVVCPACNGAFPVPADTLRRSSLLGCPACGHERAAPAVPRDLAPRDRGATVSEFPRVNPL